MISALKRSHHSIHPHTTMKQVFRRCLRWYSPLPRMSNSTAKFYRSHQPSYSGLVQPSDAISTILSQPTLVIERQIELMNVFLGFEQANKYQLYDPYGNRLGYLMERDVGIGKMILRQIYRLHRPFVVDLFDNSGNVLLTIKRPFSFINSHIKSILPGFQSEEDGIVGESVQSWHLWRRRYNLFLKNDKENYDQFGACDAPFLSFEFPVNDETGKTLGAVSRNFVGFGRELFTDTGVYIVRMDPQSFVGLEDHYPSVSSKSMSLDHRAVLLGTAISIDFDYFSRHSNRGGLFSFGSYDDI